MARPMFDNGSIVRHAGATYRVVGISVDHPIVPVFAAALEDDEDAPEPAFSHARRDETAGTGAVTYDLEPGDWRETPAVLAADAEKHDRHVFESGDGARLADVAEADLRPVHPRYFSGGPKRRAALAAAAGPGDRASVTDGAAVSRG